MRPATKFTLAVVASASIAISATTAIAADSSLPGGASSLSESHGDWTVACRVVNGKNKPGRVCSMSQQQSNRNGQRALTIDLQPKGKGAAGVIILPFGVAVTEGIHLAVDGKEIGASRPFSTCLQIGCLVPLTLSKESLGKLQAGKKLSITATAVPNRSVTLPASLKGFSGAFDRTQQLLKE